MKTIWLCQDSEAEYDLLQLYCEARASVDMHIPRGEQQMDWVRYMTKSERRRWLSAHDFKETLQDRAGDLP